MEDRSKQRSNVRLLKARWLNGITQGKAKESFKGSSVVLPLCHAMHCHSHWRKAKKFNREEKDKFIFHSSRFKKRHLKFLSQEKNKFWMLFPNFEKRNQEFTLFERRKRNLSWHLLKQGIWFWVEMFLSWYQIYPPKLITYYAAQLISRRMYISL